MAATVRIMLANKDPKVQGVIRVGPDDTVLTALDLMRANNIGSLIVLKDSYFLGIITERDIVRKVEVEGKRSAETRVREVWTCCDDIVSVSPDATLQDCLDLMDRYDIRHLPVIDGESEYAKVVGVISIRDVVREFSSKAQTNDNTRDNLPRS